MVYGLSNVPLWAFPKTDDGWKRLDGFPLFKSFSLFSNNNVDSVWSRVDWPTLRYVCEKLAERGKKYRITAFDRDEGCLELCFGASTAGSRKDLLLGIKKGNTSVWKGVMAWIETLSSNLSGVPGVEVMVWNGAEGRDSRDSHHFDWDTMGESKDFEDTLEIFTSTLENHGVRVVRPSYFRHRYWARNSDGSLYRHYHTTISWRPNVTGTIYQETGVHVSLNDDLYYLKKMFSSFKRYAREWWWHGVIDVNANEPDPVYAWSSQTLGSLKYPKSRGDYHGLLWGEQGSSIEEWLVSQASSL